MKRRVCIFIVLIAVISLGCSPLNVKAEFDSEAIYTGYSSFAMYEKSDLKTHAPLVYKRGERAIIQEMVAKGYQEAAPDQADVLIAVHISTWHRIAGTTYGYRFRFPVVDVHYYHEGTLVIDIVDRKENDLVWRGTASGLVSDNPGSDEQKVIEVVGAILAKYPPP